MNREGLYELSNRPFGTGVPATPQRRGRPLQTCRGAFADQLSPLFRSRPIAAETFTRRNRSSPAVQLADAGGLLPPGQPSKAARPLPAEKRQLCAHVGRLASLPNPPEADIPPFGSSYQGGWEVDIGNMSTAACSDSTRGRGFEARFLLQLVLCATFSAAVHAARNRACGRRSRGNLDGAKTERQGEVLSDGRRLSKPRG